jgi:hypothetical protein
VRRRRMMTSREQARSEFIAGLAIIIAVAAAALMVVM